MMRRLLRGALIGVLGLGSTAVLADNPFTSIGKAAWDRFNNQESATANANAEINASTSQPVQCRKLFGGIDRIALR